MKCFLSILFISIHSLISGQTISYKKLDSLSLEFSKNQKEADGLTYNDGNQNYEVSFPQENLKVWAHNHLASYAIYKKWGNKEVLAITENIDLSKANSLVIYSIYTLKNGNLLVTYRLHFPKDNLNTTLYEDGKVLKTLNESYIDLFLIQPDVFYNKVSELKFYSFFNKFINFIYTLKNEKGLNIAYNLKTIQEDWNKAIDSKEISFYNSFMAKYPKSIYDEQCKLNVNRLNKEIQKLIKNQNYVNSIAEKYKYERNYTLEQFLKNNQDASVFLKNAKVSYNDKFINYNSKMKLKNYLGNPWSNGISSISVNNNSKKVTSCIYNVTGKTNEVYNSYQSFVSELKKNVSEEYIKTNNNYSITIAVPGAKSIITVNFFNHYSKWSVWTINFFE